MGYCTKCGAELKEHQNFCTQCGKPVNETIKTPSQSVDDGGFGWALLGFCVPVAGLVLYLVWQTDKPLSAKAAGKGALVSVIISAVLAVIYFIVLFSMLASGAYIGVGY